MKMQIVLLITLYCSSPAMELRRRPEHISRECISYADTSGEKSNDKTQKKLIQENGILSQDERRLYRERVFSEINQKTPVSTLIVGSLVICCSGIFMLWGHYENNK